jgi:hypothetical protein
MGLDDKHDDMAPEVPEQRIDWLMCGEVDRAAALRGQTLTPPRDGIEPVSLSDYRMLCKAVLPEDNILSEDLLHSRLAFMDQDSRLKIAFPAPKEVEGPYRCLLAAIPFTEGGSARSAEEIAKGEHVRSCIIAPDGRMVSGFGMDPSFAHRFLPAEVQALAFDIPAYESSVDVDPLAMEGDRAVLKGLYGSAYRGLQALFPGGE